MAVERLARRPKRAVAVPRESRTPVALGAGGV